MSKEDKCPHPTQRVVSNCLQCIDCGRLDPFVTASQMQILKDEIALLKQRSHTHKFTTLPICERCNEVQSLCGCPHKFPPANY
jgi:Fe2+ or Zn2+ uptake regulation protein